MFIIILLILLLFGNIKLTNELIQRANEQNNKVQQLEHEILRLEDNVAYQHTRLQTLETNKDNVKYIHIKEQAYKQEDIKYSSIASFNPIPIIIATFASIGGVVKNILVFP